MPSPRTGGIRDGTRRQPRQRVGEGSVRERPQREPQRAAERPSERTEKASPGTLVLALRLGTEVGTHSGRTSGRAAIWPDVADQLRLARRFARYVEFNRWGAQRDAQRRLVGPFRPVRGADEAAPSDGSTLAGHSGWRGERTSGVMPPPDHEDLGPNLGRELGPELGPHLRPTDLSELALAITTEFTGTSYGNLRAHLLRSAAAASSSDVERRAEWWG